MCSFIEKKYFLKILFENYKKPRTSA